MDYLKQSHFFWQVLRAWLTDSSFPALHYNGLIMAITGAFFEAFGREVKGIPLALSHSPMRTLPVSVCSVLKELLPQVQSDGTLTNGQRALLKMVLQKLNSVDLS